MKIDKINTNNMLKIYQNSKNENINVNLKKEKKDTLEISKLGKELSNYSTEKISIPNKEKIEMLKDQIKKGVYKVDTEKLAKRIMDLIKGEDA